MRQRWARWLVAVVVPAVLGLSQLPAAAAGSDRSAAPVGQSSLVVSLSSGWAQAGPGPRTQALRTSHPLGERLSPPAHLAPAEQTLRLGLWPGTSSRASSPGSTLGTAMGGRSPPARAAC